MGAACAPAELEEVPMPIVGGLDIHRKQITFDYLDTVTGQVRRGHVAPADRAHLRAWLARFAGRDDVAFAVGACDGWRYIAEELAAAGIAVHLAEPADTAFARGRKRHAKTDKTDSRHLRMLLAEGRLPECWVPPGHILECRALLELYHDLRAEHTAWVQRIHAAHRAGPGRAAGGRGRLPVPGRAAAGGHRAGGARGPGNADARGPASAAGRGPAPERREGAGRAAVRGRAGHRAGDDLLAGRGGPVLLLPPGGPVRRAGHHRPLLRPQGPARAAVPARAAGAALGRLRGRQDPRPVLGPRPPLLRHGQGPRGRQAGRAVRGPQDPPPGLPHPGRARRRRAVRRLRLPLHDTVTSSVTAPARPGHVRSRALPMGTTAASSRRSAVSRCRPWPHGPGGRPDKTERPHPRRRGHPINHLVTGATPRGPR